MKAIASDLRSRLAHAFLGAGLTASIAYVALRVIERFRTGPRDPLATLSEAHTGFYWRWVIAAWIGSVVGVLYYIGVSKHEQRARQGLWLTLLAGPILALLTWLQP